MPIYNLLEYSDDYCMTSGSLWNYCRHQINDSPIEINNCNRKNNKKTTTSKSFEYKTKLIGGAPNNNNILDAEVSIIPRAPKILVLIHLFWMWKQYKNQCNISNK